MKKSLIVKILAVFTLALFGGVFLLVGPPTFKASMKFPKFPAEAQIYLATEQQDIGISGRSVMIDDSQYVPYKTTALKPVEEAYWELKKTGKKYVGVSGQWVSIDSVSLGYWLVSDGGQQLAYPIYVFKGRVFDVIDGWRWSAYEGWVEATDESNIEFPSVA